MPWTPAQIKTAHIAKSQLGWNEDTYRLALRNAAGIRPQGGNVSSKNTYAGNAEFERFMAFCEISGFIDANHPRGYWVEKANQQCERIHYKIKATEDHCRQLGLIGPGAFDSFIERMTANRPQGPTRILSECDAIDSFKILEGFKAWMYRLARERDIPLNLSTGATNA